MGYMIGAYWGPRAESVAEIASKARQLCEILMERDCALTTWHLPGNNIVDSLRNVINPVDEKALIEAMLARKTGNKSSVRTDDLGFRVNLWNGEKDGIDVSLSILAGAFWSGPNAPPNNVIIRWGAQLGRFSDPHLMSDVLAAVCSTFAPVWGGVISDEAVARAGGLEEPLLDWMLYLPSGEPPNGSNQAKVFLKGGGKIFVTENGPEIAIVDQANARSLN